jgi:lysozyme family protein
VNFDDAFTALMGNEGGYSFNPADPGGETMWGITARVARAYGYAGQMKDLQQDYAKKIAFAEYWQKAHCDELPDSIKFDAFDCAYNMGVHEAIILIQRVCGVPADGYWGDQTKNAVALLDRESAQRKFAAARLVFYTNLPTWDTFGKGWSRRVAENLTRS